MIQTQTREARPAQVQVGRLQYNRAMIDFIGRMVISAPFDAERFHVLFVDRTGAYLGDTPMGLGGAGRVTLRMRELFSQALSHRAHGILVAHNHPSGLCQPSQADLNSTRRLEAIATALDIEIVDHLIFTKGAVYSMRAGAVHEFKSRTPVLSR